jgi:hypothetical protein
LLHLPLLFLPLVLLLWEARTETQDTEARKQRLLCQHRLSRLVPKG